MANKDDHKLGSLIDGLFSDEDSKKSENLFIKDDSGFELKESAGAEIETKKKEPLPPPRIIKTTVEEVKEEPVRQITHQEAQQTENINIEDEQELEDRYKISNSHGSLDLGEKFDPNAYNQYSAAVDEIMNYIPAWIIRWGNTLIAGIVGLILMFSYLIKYPDIIQGTSTLTTMNPPVAIVSKSEGEIEIKRTENDLVNRDDIIAVIERDASYDDIEFLKSILDQDLAANRNAIIGELSSRSLRLGNVQMAYSDFYSKMQNSVVQKSEFATNQGRIGKLREQIALSNQLLEEQQKQIALLEEEYSLAQSIVKNRYQPMYAQGSISREQLERKINESNMKRSNLQEARKRLSEYQKSVIDIQSQIDNMNFSNSRINNNLQGNITDAVARLRNSISSWEHQYLIKAPTRGVISFASFLKDYSFVRQQQELAYIVPEAHDGQDSIYAEVLLSGKGSGRLELGQKVLIVLDAYPKKQYGRLEGELVNLSEVGTDIQGGEQGSQYVYRAEVALTNGFQSTMGKEIEFKHNMRGSAEVITKDVRLIQRLFNELYNAFDY